MQATKQRQNVKGKSILIADGGKYRKGPETIV